MFKKLFDPTYKEFLKCEAIADKVLKLEEEYKKSIDEAISFLNGHYDKVLKRLENEMQTASENMEFEKAAEYRDLLNSVNAIAVKVIKEPFSARFINV